MTNFENEKEVINYLRASLEYCNNLQRIIHDYKRYQEKLINKDPCNNYCTYYDDIIFIEREIKTMKRKILARLYDADQFILKEENML